MTTHLSVGVAVLELRRHLGWSRQGLAEELHVAYQSISRYERGQMIPELQILGRLAQLSANKGRLDLARVFLGPFSNVLNTTVGALEKAIA